MKPVFQQVTAADAPELLLLMREFYAHSEMSWSPPTAEAALGELLHRPEKGAAWFIRLDSELVGYCVLTLAFSLEFGGTFGFLDELYVRERFRGRGIGTLTLRFLEAQCRELGAKTLRLETGFGNADGIRFYERHGLTREQRYLMTKRLD